MDDAEDRQSVRAAFEDILAITFALCAVTFVLFFLAQFAPGAGGALTMIIAAGQLFFDHLGWTMSLYLAALFALYAVVLGRQLIGASEDAPRIRRRLGALAEFIAAAALLLLLLVVAYLISEPAKLPMLAILIPMAGLTLALSVHLGTFAAFDRSSRYLEALRIRSIVLDRLTKLKRVSNVPAPLVLLANSVVTAALATVLTMPFMPSSSGWLALVSFGVYLSMAAGAMLGLAVALYFFWTSTDVYARYAFWGVPLTYYVLAVAALWSALHVYQVAPGARAYGALSFAVLGVSLITTLWPRSFGGRHVLKWSLNGGVARSAARKLERESSQSLRHLDALLHMESAYRDVRHWLLAGAEKFRSDPLPSSSANGPTSA